MAESSLYAVYAPEVSSAESGSFLSQDLTADLCMVRKHYSLPGQELACSLTWSSGSSPCLVRQAQEILGLGQREQLLSNWCSCGYHSCSHSLLLSNTKLLPSLPRHGSFMEQCRELLYKTDPRRKRRRKERAPPVLELVLGSTGHTSLGQVKVFGLSARLYGQN